MSEWRTFGNLSPDSADVARQVAAGRTRMGVTHQQGPIPEPQWSPESTALVRSLVEGQEPDPEIWNHMGHLQRTIAGIVTHPAFEATAFFGPWALELAAPRAAALLPRATQFAGGALHTIRKGLEAVDKERTSVKDIKELQEHGEKEKTKKGEHAGSE
jgi:hypothetical protein